MSLLANPGTQRICGAVIKLIMQPLANPGQDTFIGTGEVRMRKAVVLSTVLVALSSTAHGEIIADGDFSNWNFNATGTATVTRV